MKSAFVAGALLAAALAVSPSIHSSDASDRPPGVAKEAWIPINDRVGFVLYPRSTEPRIMRAPPQPLLLAPPVSGYFMLKGASGWARMVIVEPLRGPGDSG